MMSLVVGMVRVIHQVAEVFYHLVYTVELSARLMSEKLNAIKRYASFLCAS